MSTYTYILAIHSSLDVLAGPGAGVNGLHAPGKDNAGPELRYSGGSSGFRYQVF